MTTYVDLDSIHRPANGLTAPATWGDQVNDNIKWLYLNGGRPLAVVSYTTVAETLITLAAMVTGTNASAVDTTNLATTVTVPPDGNLLVRLSAYCKIATGSASAQFWFQAMASGVALSKAQKVGMLATTGITEGRFVSTHYLTGLTPGATQSVQFGAAVGAGQTGPQMSIGGVGSGLNGGGAALLEVWAA